MSRRSHTFDNIKFFTKKALRKYSHSTSTLLNKTQRDLTVVNVNEDDFSFRRKEGNSGIISTQQLPLDNSSFFNNTFFGSAEVKVNVAFDKIVNNYPFDGSYADVESFEDKLSSFEKYVLDKFPKSTGFLNLDSSNKQHIVVKDSSGFLNANLAKGSIGEAFIDPKDQSFSVECHFRVTEDLNQNSFLFYNVSSNNVGFFAACSEDSLIKNISVKVSSYAASDRFFFDDTYPPSISFIDGRTYVFDVSDNSNSNKPLRFSTTLNGTHDSGVEYNTGVTATGTPGEAGATVQVVVSSITPKLYPYCSPQATLGGTSQFSLTDSQVSKITFGIISGSNHKEVDYLVPKGEWRNFSFVYDRSGLNQHFMKIMSGSEVIQSSSFFSLDGLGTAGSNLVIGDGESLTAGNYSFIKDSTFDGCLDEFRVFHNLRPNSEISYYSKRNIFAHDNLRLSFRFNEASGDHKNNDIVLDHCGNSLHAKIENFASNVRTPGDIKNPMYLEDKRFNPILFPSYPSVMNLNSSLLEDASEYDVNNPNIITKLIPQHYLQEGAFAEGMTVDGEIVESYSSSSNLPGSGKMGSAQLMSLFLYFIAEELDFYKMYVDQVSQLLFSDYNDEEGVSSAFLQDLARYYGFELPAIFGDASFEQFLGSENLGLEYATYERGLSKIQNIIWRRVLKNLNHIFKSKGTKYAIKSIFRSAGIEPDRMFRIVEYNGIDKFRLGTSRQEITEMSTMLNFSGSLTPKLVETPYYNGTLIDRPTLLSAALTGSRIEPGYPPIAGGNVLATGTINFHPLMNDSVPAAGSTFTIQDSFGKTKTFEFTTDGDPAGTNVAINISGKKSRELASTLTGSIEAQFPNSFNMSIGRNSAGSNVDKLSLTTKDFSRYNLGNHAITYTAVKTPVLWVRMSATTASDISKYSRTLTSTNPPTFSVASEDMSRNKYYVATFDGANDEIGLGTAATWDTICGTGAGSTATISISSWVRPTAAGEDNFGRIIDISSQHAVYLASNGKVTFQYSFANTAGLWETDVAVFNYGSPVWKHISVTYTGIVENDPIIYVDGAAVAIVKSVQPVGVRVAITGDGAFIGNRSAGDRTFAGKIAEVVVFNQILSAADISSIYLAQSDYWIPPYFAAKGFASGNGFINAGNTGYEENGISATSNDGLLTSGSWSVEGIYQFPSNLPEERERSLSRLISSGSSAGIWEDRYGVLTNLVLSKDGGTLSLFVRSAYPDNADTFSLFLTGANVLNGKKWYVCYGRQRNDSFNNHQKSKYFIRAASYDYNKLSTFLTTESVFYEGTPETNLFQNTEPVAGTTFSPPCLLIGSQSYTLTGSGNFLNSDVASIPSATKVTYFDGKVGHIKFWSKNLSEDESKEHARNFKSVGVDNPMVNNTFDITSSGSFEKLRLNLSTDQIDLSTIMAGKLGLTDFSQNYTNLNATALAQGAYTALSGGVCFGFESEKQIIEPSRFDYTIISPFFDEYLESDKIKIAAFSEGENIKLYNSKISPVTKIEPYEKEVNDNRFEIQLHLQRGLDEDIMNIFSTIEALDNAIGKPELIFTQEYPDLVRMRELYFNRLTDKVNYRNFFDLFRWIDDAFSDMVAKMVPRNSNFLGINLIIESHALERYKIAYGHQDIYLGEDFRANLRSVLLLSQMSGVIRRF